MLQMKNGSKTKFDSEIQCHILYIDQKLTVGIAGGLQQVFFLQHMVQASKKSGAAFAPSGKVPQIPPRTPKSW